MDDLISRRMVMALAKDICVPIEDGTVYKHRCIDPDAVKELPSAQPEILACGEGELNVPDTNVGDCSDCIKHGGDWDCDHVHCHKGKSAQPENDMIHLQKEQAYLQGWEEGRKALRKEIWGRWARQT